MEEDFLVYAGFEKGDFCYYRPHRYSPKMLEHLEVVKSVVSEPWQAMEEFSFAKDDSFPLIKSFGSKEQMELLSQKLLSFEEVHSTYIGDPLSHGKTYLNLITSKRATKGEVVKKMRAFFPKGTHFIAAGDDRNDILMLEEADFAIVMKTAPESMHFLADLMAEPAEDFGIIEALLKATGESA